MAHKIVWTAYAGGWIGVLPCTLTVGVIRIEPHPNLSRAYCVSFGTHRLRDPQWDLVNAKKAGVELARRTLTECLAAMALEQPND